MLINNKLKIVPEVFILAGIILFFVITNTIWLAIDDVTPPSWDDSAHMRTSILYSRLIPKAIELNTIREISALSDFYPPFFYLSSLPIIYFFGFQEDIIIYINFLYLIILVLSVYGIGSLLYNKKVGILSALLTLLYPIIAGLSRRYLIDFALVAAVSLTYYFILKYKQEREKKWFVFLTIAVIVSILIKQTAIIFYFPAAALFLKKDVFKQRLFLVIMITILAIFIFIFYSRYMKHIFFLFSCDGNKLIMERFISNILWYIKALNACVVLPVLLLFFLLGFFLLLFFDKKRERIRFLLIWIVPSFFIFSLFRWRDPRWIMPALPAFAIITIAGFNALPHKRLRNFTLLFILLIGLAQFLNLSFNLFSRKNSYYCRAPLMQNWRVKEILEFISDRYKSRNIKIGIFPNCEYFNPNGFALYLLCMDLPYSYEGLWWRPLPFGANVKYCDIVITKIPFTSNYANDRYSAKSYEDKIEKMLKEYNFKNIKNFPLPDNSKAMIYQKRL